MYKAKILESTALPFKYLSNFWRLLKMPLINFKVDLKLKWTKCCVDNANSNNTILVIKELYVIKLYVHIVTLPAKNNRKLSKLLSKGFEVSVY